MEECGERLKRILESPSIPQANHQLLVHLSRHLARVSQHNQTGPRLLGQAFAEAVFKHSPLRYGRLHRFSHRKFLIENIIFNNIPSLLDTVMIKQVYVMAASLSVFLRNHIFSFCLVHSMADYGLALRSQSEAWIRVVANSKHFIIQIWNYTRHHKSSRTDPETEREQTECLCGFYEV